MPSRKSKKHATASTPATGQLPKKTVTQYQILKESWNGSYVQFMLSYGLKMGHIEDEEEARLIMDELIRRANEE